MNEGFPENHLWSDIRFAALVHALPQALAGLEEDGVTGAHSNCRTILRIAADALRTIFQSEGAETANLDAAAFNQRVGHRIDDHGSGIHAVALAKRRKTSVELSKKFGFGHGITHGCLL